MQALSRRLTYADALRLEAAGIAFESRLRCAATQR